MQQNGSKREFWRETLDDVCSLSQACHAWGKSRTAIMNAINRGDIVAERIGRDWILSIPSVRARYGNAVRKIKR